MRQYYIYDYIAVAGASILLLMKQPVNEKLISKDTHIKAGEQ